MTDETHELGPEGDCQRFWNSYDGDPPIGGDIQVWKLGNSEIGCEWVIEWTGPNLIDDDGVVQACDCPICEGEESVYSHYVVECNIAGDRVSRRVSMSSLDLPVGRGKRPTDVTVKVVRKEEEG